LRFFDVFYLLQKVLNTQDFAKKKPYKKLLQKNRKITKNLKCKMKKMTHPPFTTTTFYGSPPKQKQKNLKWYEQFFVCSTKTL